MNTMSKRKWELFFEAIIDGILAFTDYFVVRKHITLSEATLFALAATRAFWFTLFGVNIGPSPGPLAHEAWTPFFWLLTLAHFATFFMSDLIYRIGVLCAYAVIWCFLAMLVAVTTYTSPALPTFMTFSFLSVFIAVRLIRDWRT
jgi:hypothetical protein